ncbi:ricin-type beta-trefoil lectin domain protein [Streptomyces anulatus]|uniref:ricin-type beta-trefoil lectin domain protein n=1 Tax=Streptomyces anulatus TaxID=1892 RepID=UPI00224FCFEC|nr:ricin-type beta-trefoil lectin domain protein [Streptomyces anulatus]MCX4516776.1 ricin-type beta-trefoil lectin domain protein [Streptomyces anulatus]
MTRSSSQQTPASASPEARAESGAESERAAASSTENAALVGPVAPDAPDSAPVHAKSEAAEAEPSATGKPSKAEKPSEAGKGEKAGKPEGGERPEARAPDGGAATPGAAAPDSETDPSASAAAQSRLPALVRTMTATAIGQPQQEAGPVGRPGRAALAGAAVVGAVLVSVPFLVLAGNNDDGPKQTNAAAAGTVLDGSGPEAPGEFAVTAPETSAPAEDGKGKKDEAKPGKAGNPVPVVPSADGGKEEAKKGDGSKDTAEKADSSEEQPEKESGGGKNQPAKAQPAVTFSGPVSFRSHLSGRCLDVPGHNFNDGQPLFMWDCNGADAQKWRFGSDGTIRARDKCLDVANANFNNGSRIQLAWCNGADAQKFTLNGAHDLVNTAVGKCVDIPNHSKGRGPETYLILFDCTGNDNQKWST